MKLDILGIFAHPDDAELCCAGTLLKHVSLGKSVGVVDITMGQLGSRGTPMIRLAEADKAAQILGLAIRDNLELEDGYIENDAAHRLKIIEAIRKYQPEIVITNAIEDRHPDHGRAAKLVSDSCFFSGLHRIKSIDQGQEQDAWRPKVVYHAVQDRYLKPHFIVDVSPFVDKKFEAIMAFESQFYSPNSTEPDTPISTKEFLEVVKARMRDYGRLINAEFGEGFTSERPLGIADMTQLI
ncbi:MAG: bacillithiol biosynthesis deacetylase BshB1 [Bacteroidota bacterium]